MSTTEDIDKAVEIFKNYRTDYELMHCVSTYPMKTEHANLNTIDALRDKYQCKVGYSGHEPGVAVSLAASMKNISSLERHITLDRSMYGTDQSASLEFPGMNFLIKTIKKMQLSLGEKKLGHVLDEEKELAKKLRAHIKKI